MERTGKCVCGSVTYTGQFKSEVSACHCDMCRRWAGGPLLAATAESINWQGEEHVTTFTSSAWAERGFCNKCGSNLFYRVTAPGKYHGLISVALGTLDDQTGLEMTKEWFIDKKPELYSLEGERTRVTEADVMAMFAATNQA